MDTNVSIHTGSQTNWIRSPMSAPGGRFPPLNKKGIKQVHQIVGSILYYARAVDMTVLMALSMIAIDQTKATKKMMVKCTQLLDYLANHSEAKV
jgi:hypothetical protein